MLAVFAIVPLPFSCNIIDGGGGCPDTRYTLDGFHSLQVNEGAITNDTLDVSQLTLVFNFVVSPIHTALLQDTERHFGSFLIPSARALSCLGPHVEPYIATVRVTSDRHFNADYPSGSELRPLFDSIYRINEAGEWAIGVINYEPNATDPLQGYCAMTLTELPTSSEVHVFVVSMELSDGTSYTVGTGPIRFN